MTSRRGGAYDYNQAIIDVARGAKICTSCGVDRPLEEYGVRKNHPTGRLPHCKICCSIRTKNSYRKNIELHRIKDMANYYVRNYKMSYKDAVQRALGNRSGECEICNSTVDTVVDHCHTTGKVRGMLCSGCNSILGYAKDNTDTLQKAVEYFNKYRGVV